MVNLQPKRTSVNNMVSIIDSTLESSELEEYPNIKKIYSDQTLEEQLHSAKKLRQRISEYREKELPFSQPTPPLKTGPMKIIRSQLELLEEELEEFERRLASQQYIEYNSKESTRV